MPNLYCSTIKKYISRNLQKNICGSRNNCENHECFALYKYSVYFVELCIWLDITQLISTMVHVVCDIMHMSIQLLMHMRTQLPKQFAEIWIWIYSCNQLPQYFTELQIWIYSCNYHNGWIYSCNYHNGSQNYRYGYILVNATIAS